MELAFTASVCIDSSRSVRATRARLGRPCRRCGSASSARFAPAVSFGRRAASTAAASAFVGHSRPCARASRALAPRRARLPAYSSAPVLLLLSARGGSAGDDDSRRDAEGDGEYREGDEEREDVDGEQQQQQQQGGGGGGGGEQDENTRQREGRSDSGSRDVEFDLGPREGAVGDGDEADEQKKSKEEEEEDEAEKAPYNPVLEYVNSLSPPQTIRRFMENAPREVQTAMKQSVVNIVGNLPPLTYRVSVTTLGQKLAELMYSTMMTGYMFRNVEYRLSLSNALSLPMSRATEDSSDSGDSDNDDDDDDTSAEEQQASLSPSPPPSQQQQHPHAILPDSTLRVQNADGSITEVNAAEYIQELRDEVRALRDELAHYRSGSNSVLAYVRSLEPDNLAQLTQHAGEQVTDAMKRLTRQLMEQSRISDEQAVTTPTIELSSLLFWLMVLGYDVRGHEVKLDFERKLYRGYLDGGVGGDEEAEAEGQQDEGAEGEHGTGGDA